MDHIHQPSATRNRQRRVALYHARLTTGTVAVARTRYRRYILRDDRPMGFGVRVSKGREEDRSRLSAHACRDAQLREHIVRV